MLEDHVDTGEEKRESDSLVYWYRVECVPAL